METRHTVVGDPAHPATVQGQGVPFDPTLDRDEISKLPPADGLGSQSAAEARLFPNRKVYTLEMAERPVVVEVGRVAKQANGSAWVRYGDTMVLVTATVSAQLREGVDFFPLTVDYEERQYAAGRIPGNFFRREGRPTERATLAMRLTDRSLRPLFPEGFRNDVQVIAIVQSADGDNPPEFCGILGASLALTISDIPFGGPVGAVLVGRVDGQLVVNPTAEQQVKSDLHLWVAGTRDAVLMVEAGAREVPEDVVLEGITLGHQEIKRLVEWQNAIAAEVGRPKREVPVFEAPPEVEAAVREVGLEPLRGAVRNPDKLRREADTERVEEETLAALGQRWGAEPDLEGRLKQASAAFKKLLREEVRRMILGEGSRPDGRGPGEIRPISCQVSVLPRVHGSGLFTRGQTQVVTVATLGSVGDVQLLDSLENEEFKRFMHHYNFPPFSVGETRPLRGPSRRDVGHGALVERALEAVLPDEDFFPYTIRLVSEVLESNGSTSMASVCGGCLALMDAGVPVRAPVAGIAMGLVREGDRVAVLSDIQGVEDALGDMDFKVAGTGRGITALQMDIKSHGIDAAVLSRALAQARQGRLFILSRLLEAMPQPRPELSPYAPRIIIVEIDPDKIRDVIGPGGKTVNRIVLETGVKMDIEDDGKIYIASSDLAAAQKALKMVEDLTRDVVVGGVYQGKITRLMNFGAFAEILPGKEGLIHISQLAENRVEKVEDVVKVGDEVLVKVIEIDSLGRINLSRKELLKGGRGAAQAQERGGEPRQPQAASEEMKPLDLHHRPALRNRRRRGRRR